MKSQLRDVDHSALLVNQVSIIVLLLAAFITNQPLLVALVTLILLIGTAVARPGFLFLYRGVLKPLGIVKPRLVKDNPEPHRFAQGVACVVVEASTVALCIGSDLIGWVFSWMVIVLAAINVVGGFCAGCAIYYWLHRLRTPGFVKAPPAGTAIGMRPHA